MLNFRYFDAWLKNTRDGTCNRSAISKFKPNALYSFCWRYIHMILQLNSIPPTPNLSMNLRREPLELPLSLIYRTHPRILWIFLGDLRPHSTPIIASLKNQITQMLPLYRHSGRKFLQYQHAPEALSQRSSTSKRIATGFYSAACQATPSF